MAIRREEFAFEIGHFGKKIYGNFNFLVITTPLLNQF